MSYRNRYRWSSGQESLALLVGLILMAMGLPFITGLKAKLPEPVQPLTQTIGEAEAVARTLEGASALVDLGSLEEQERRPLLVTAIRLPAKLDHAEWERLDPLLRSLKETPVYVVFPREEEHVGFSKLRDFELELWAVTLEP